ncbi:hypothetical protein O3M35_010127 [Rhynocoris fuscipes]|uniref:Uncharacterized protein n=1 Tax=Rhynocoris fuscipes TaxID=488301 RepID=A0AAW1CY46_9HEMI
MAPLKPVRTLYDLSLDSVLETVHTYVVKRQGELVKYRKFLIKILHGAIRETLIERAVNKYSSNVLDVLDIVELLADSSIKQLQIIIMQHVPGVLSHTGCFSGQLFSKIDSANIIGLHKLIVKVQVDLHSNSTQIEPLSSVFHCALHRGLAANLRVLTLHNAADNQSLKIIGKYAKHLTNLDITSSWIVDDVGICDLLLKDASNFITAHCVELDNCEPRAIHALSLFPESQINKTCETLCEVKIQDTNTSSISVLLLLMFAKSLKSLGGFLYFRNIGDAVLSVQSRENAPESLALTELWDTQLPYEKLSKIAQYLPKLTTLYTRAACLLPEPNIVPPLTNLTADFDFVQYGPQFFRFLSCNGASIRRLVLIDQVYSLDLETIAEYCPILEELTAKVSVDNVCTSGNTCLKNLKTAKLRITSAATFTWIMKKCYDLLHLEVLLERDNFESNMFENDVIMQIIEDNPRSLKCIRYLSIHMFWNPRYQNFVVSCGNLTIDAAYALCSACDNLNVIGELHTWFKVTNKDVIALAAHIKKSNWNVRLRYRDVLYP